MSDKNFRKNICEIYVRRNKTAAMICWILKLVFLPKWKKTNTLTLTQVTKSTTLLKLRSKMTLDLFQNYDLPE